jgi:hypothetical protein
LMVCQWLVLWFLQRRFRVQSLVLFGKYRWFMLLPKKAVVREREIMRAPWSLILQCQPLVQHLEKFPKGIWKSVDITPRKEEGYYSDTLRVRGILSLYVDIKSLLPLLSIRHKNPHPPLPNVLCLFRLIINFTSCSMTGKANGSGHSQNVGRGTASC